MIKELHAAVYIVRDCVRWFDELYADWEDAHRAADSKRREYRLEPGSADIVVEKIALNVSGRAVAGVDWPGVAVWLDAGDDVAEIPAGQIVMVPARSGYLAETGYDPATRTLLVRFRTGELHRYQGVPPHLVEEMYAAESVGRYFYRHIRRAHKSERVGAPSEGQR
jgi:hypothetical protein